MSSATSKSTVEWSDLTQRSFNSNFNSNPKNKTPNPKQQKWKKWIKGLVLTGVALVGAFGVYHAIKAAGSPAAFKPIVLPAEPLYLTGTGVKPTLSLALSVEFPTVGNQYDLDSYSTGTEYLGYFDADSCYTYNNTPAPTLEVGSTSPAHPVKRFDFASKTTTRTCAGTTFSGNFLNWSTTSGIDLLRLALTGGDRIVDTPNLTVLQRAVLPGTNQDNTNGNSWSAYNNFFNNSAYFKTKTLRSADVAGAVPNALKGTHAGDIFIANCRNRIHFGTSNPGGGTCDSPGALSNLGVPGGTSGTKPLSTDAFFYSRVEVCSMKGAALQDPRTADPVGAITATTPPRLCKKQPSGFYKPIGNIQKHSDDLRVAAFGYLLDNDINGNVSYGRGLYGGVLRAPMTFAGPTAYTTAGAPTANPKSEWDANTGVFLDDPEGVKDVANNVHSSGVVNYVNRFGRNGLYKVYDPVAELYYEALRYLQGKQPTTGAIPAGMPNAMKDGSPVYSSWTDPHAGGDKSYDYSCVKNNIFVVSDINTQNDKSIPGNTMVKLPSESPSPEDYARGFSVADNEPNFKDWTRVVGGFEANVGVPYSYTKATKGSVPQGMTTYNPNPLVAHYKGYTTSGWSNPNPMQVASTLVNLESQVSGYDDLSGYYIAGMAYWANTNDIRGTGWTNSPAQQRPGMRVKTYVLDVNSGNGSLVYPGTEADNLSKRSNDYRRQQPIYLAAKYGGFDESSSLKGSPFYQVDAAGAGVQTNALWKKPIVTTTSIVGDEAKNYYVAGSPRDLLNGVDSIFTGAKTGGNSLGGSSLSSNKISAGAFAYGSKYEPNDWSGDVIANPIKVVWNPLTGQNEIKIDQAVAWSASSVLDVSVSTARKIYTAISSTSTGTSGVNFQWSNIGATHQSALNAPKTGQPSDGNGQKRLNYLRGIKTDEGTLFRPRTHLLGDVVNSPVVLLPNTFVGGDNSVAYNSFTTTNGSRPATVFFGANDGMLHALDASNGKELFAYIPSWTVPKLSDLTDPLYNTTMHQSYVDGPIEIQEAQVGTAWKTVLVGSTGGGGQGVFALDVSNSKNFAANNVMWEFTDKDDADLGNVIGKPQILKFRTNTVGSLPAVYKYFAVVASGVNNFVSDGSASNTGQPTLFLLDLSKSAGTPWSKGSNYYKISMPVDSTLSDATTGTSPGILNFIGVGLNAIDKIYAGDLHGNLWLLDFASAQRTYNLSALDFDKLTSKTTQKPLFIATDASGKRQPISMAPTVVFGPNGGHVLTFGTGKYLENADNTLAGVQTQSMYAIYDNNFASPRLPTIGNRNVDLMKGVATTGGVSVPAFAWGRPNPTATATTPPEKAGWYADYPTPGERQITNMQTFGGNITFTSVVPPQTAANPCEVGASVLYNVGIATGSGTATKSTVGMLAAPLLIEVDAASGLSNPTTTTPRDNAGRRTKKVGQAAIALGANGVMPVVLPSVNILLGRLSWRQISNYNELHHEATNP